MHEERPIVIVLVLISLLTACVPPQPEQALLPLTVFANSLVEPWLADLYACAEDLSIAITISADSPDLFLQLGEPQFSTEPIYEIGQEELFIAAHAQSPLSTLSLEEAQTLFQEMGSNSLQAWGYSSGVGSAWAFDSLVMKERGAPSSILLAVDAKHMAKVLSTQPEAVGILPARWITGNIRPLLSLGRVPVLAQTKEPGGVAASMLACLQND